MKEPEGIIGKINNEKYRFALRERYRDAEEWRSIVDMLGYSESHLFRLHSAALKEFDSAYSAFQKDDSK